MTPVPNCVLIQASSTSWQGEKDACMVSIDDKTLLEMTILKFKEALPETSIFILAPEFDKNGELNQIAKKYSVDISFNYDDSPAARINEAVSNLKDNDYFLRIDGLNFLTRRYDILETLNIFNSLDLDFLKFEDDFPPQISFEIYKKSCFSFMYSHLKNFDNVFQVHIKHLASKFKNLNKHYYFPQNLSKTELLNMRSSLSKAYALPRGISSQRALKIGDQLSFHYELVLNYLNKNQILLDIACGDGTGSKYLSKYVSTVYAADIDSVQIQKNISEYKIDNLYFSVENGEKLSFEDGSFDIITSMETIEHCSDFHAFLKELKRTLKDNGLLFISTPQNSIGHTPLNSAHNIEFSKLQFLELLNKEFNVINFFSIKSGRIIGDSNENGQNSFAICSKLLIK